MAKRSLPSRSFSHQAPRRGSTLAERKAEARKRRAEPSWVDGPAKPKISRDEWLTMNAERLDRAITRVVERIFFWIVKLFSVATIYPAIYVFMTYGDGEDRGLYAAVIFTLFAVGFFLKDGFSMRQWRRKDLYGFNQIIAYFGRSLLWIAAAIAIVWCGWAVIVSVLEQTDRMRDFWWR